MLSGPACTFSTPFHSLIATYRNPCFVNRCPVRKQAVSKLEELSLFTANLSAQEPRYILEYLSNSPACTCHRLVKLRHLEHIQCHTDGLHCTSVMIHS